MYTESVVRDSWKRSFQKREIVFVDIPRIYLHDYFEQEFLYICKRCAFKDFEDFSQILLLTVFEIFSCLWHFVFVDTSFSVVGNSGVERELQITSIRIGNIILIIVFALICII